MQLQPDEKRLACVDALRGFAALYVLLHHCIFIPNPALTVPSWIEPWLLNGRSGVALFFVISAFTLCLTYKPHEPHARLKFYLRRFFRIAPLYYLWLLVVIFFVLGIHTAFQQRLNLVLYTSFLFNLFPVQRGIVEASWTLSVEFLFYLLFPLIMRFARDLKRGALFLVLTLFISIAYQNYANDTAGYTVRGGILYLLPVFALGICAYYIYKCGIGRTSQKLLLITGVAGILLMPYYYQSVEPGGDYLYGILYACLLLGTPAYAIFQNRIAVFYGLISYSLYLNHSYVLYSLNRICQVIYKTGLPLLLNYAICACITLGVTTVLSILTYRFIEKPGMKFGRWLVAGLFGNVTTSRFSETAPPGEKQY